MRLKPDALNQLATAPEAFRADMLSTVPAEKRYAALMVANAQAMAEREFAAAGVEVLPVRPRSLCDCCADVAGRVRAALRR